MSQNILIFTTCKPFDGEFAVLQRNAIWSWRAGGFDVLIIGDEPGSHAIATELGCYFVEGVERSEKGIPYVSDLFNIASTHSDHEHIAYVNADILIRPETANRLRAFLRLSQKLGDYLFVTRRRSIPLFEDITARPEAWHDHVEELDTAYGVWDPPYAIDLFLVNKGWLCEIPDMTVGRAGWDNWMLQNARQQGIAVVDGSLDCPIHHPAHGYAAEAGGLEAVTTGTQAAKNRAFLEADGGRIDTSATHILENGRLLPATETGHTNFDNNLGRRVLSDLMMVNHYRAEQADRTCQDLRTLLWRANCWVPPVMPERLDSDTLDHAVKEALEAAKHNETGHALELVQTLLAHSYRGWLRRKFKEKRPLYVWGVGEAARRFCDFALRHTVEIRGFVDGTAKKAGTSCEFIDNQSRPILPFEEAAALFRAKTPPPVFHIASIHREAIVKQLGSFGAEIDKDFK